MNRRAWITVDREALLHNAAVLSGRAGVPLMAVVKANAYGHGLCETARILEDGGIRLFCTATADEGIRLRQAGIRGQILILGESEPMLAEEIAENGLVQTVADAAHAERLSRTGIPLQCHLAVDTGMHRIGIPCDDAAALKGVLHLPHLRITGVFSHLCVSSSRKEEDIAFTELQCRRFMAAADVLREERPDLCRHLLASYGIARYPAFAFDAVRAGIALYGCGEETREPIALPLRRVLSLQCRIASVRTLRQGETIGYGRSFRAPHDMETAVLSIGYGDGLLRSMAEEGYVLIRGRKAKIIGRMCMDQMMADITGIPCRQGDTATIIGCDGSEKITAEQAAEWGGTIANELLCGLSERLERRYR